MNKLFIIATKEKYRYPFKGYISTEDLWDLSPAELDEVFKKLNATRKSYAEESLLTVREDQPSMEITNQIEIIKYILNTKLEAEAAVEREAMNAVKRKQIMAILESKENDALNNMSTDELRKMLEEL